MEARMFSYWSKYMTFRSGGAVTTAAPAGNASAERPQSVSTVVNFMMLIYCNNSQNE